MVGKFVLIIEGVLPCITLGKCACECLLTGSLGALGVLVPGQSTHSCSVLVQNGWSFTGEGDAGKLASCIDDEGH